MGGFLVWMTFVIPIISLVLGLLVLLVVGMVAGIGKLIEMGSEGLVCAVCLAFLTTVWALAIFLP